MLNVALMIEASVTFLPLCDKGENVNMGMNWESCGLRLGVRWLDTAIFRTDLTVLSLRKQHLSS